MADNTILKYVSLANLQKYDEKIKSHIAAADAALKTNLEGQVGVVAGALDGEIARAKAAEQANAAAAQAAQTAANTLAGKVGTVPENQTVMGIIANIQENAYDDTEVRGLISGLDTNKADKTQVATDIAAAVKVETDARVEAVAGVQGAIDALSGTHATDKKALEDAIALKADQTALDTVSGVANAAVKQTDYDTKVAALEAEDARIAGLVTAEAERAAEVESDFEERIAKMEVFWDTTEDADGVVNKLKEIQDYIAGDETGAAEMAGNIQANTKAIEAMDEAYKAADTALQNAIDGEASTRANADTALDNRLKAVESAVGESGSVAEDIGTAKQEAIDSAVGTAAADATSKANAAEAAAKGHADSLNTAMDARVVALEAIDHEHSNKAELDLIASGDKAKWDAAAAIAHSHDNKSVIDGITAQNITTWNTVTSKAAQDDLTAVGNRVTALETWHNDFTECSEKDINDMFA